MYAALWAGGEHRGPQEAKQPTWLSAACNLQTLLVAHSELYSEARLSVTFDLPDGSARWAVQLQLGKLEGNATALEMEVCGSLRRRRSDPVCDCACL